MIGLRLFRHIYWVLDPSCVLRGGNEVKISVSFKDRTRSSWVGSLKCGREEFFGIPTLPLSSRNLPW